MDRAKKSRLTDKTYIQTDKNVTKRKIIWDIWKGKQKLENKINW